MNSKVQILIIFALPLVIQAQLNLGQSYSIYNGQYVPKEESWFSSAMKSMDVFNLFGSSQQGPPVASPAATFGYYPPQNQYLEEGAASSFVPAVIPQQAPYMYNNIPPVQQAPAQLSWPQLDGYQESYYPANPNENGNYGFQQPQAQPSQMSLNIPESSYLNPNQNGNYGFQQPQAQLNTPESSYPNPNQNGNNGFLGLFRPRGQGANNQSPFSLNNLFNIPMFTSTSRPFKDLSYFQGSYKRNMEVLPSEQNSAMAMMNQPQPGSLETPYGKKQKKQCNKQSSSYIQPDANGEAVNYKKQPCKKKTASTPETPTKHEEKEKTKEGDDDEMEDGSDYAAEEPDDSSPCPPIGLWFWNGEVCIASGPVPTWACKPNDLVSTGRVATCRNKIIIGPPRGRGNSGSSNHQNSAQNHS